MAQILEVTSAVSWGPWVGSISDLTDTTDSTSIEAEEGSGSSYGEWHIENPTDPFASDNHTVTVRAREQLGSGAISIQLLQGSTVIRQSTGISLTTSFANYGFTLSASEANSITNYSDLRIKVRPDSGYTGFIEVTRIEMSIPDLAVPDQVTGVSASDGTYTNKIRITWNSAARATSYKIYRRTTDSIPGSHSFTDTASPYDDTTPVAETTYYYWVKGTNSSGDGPASTSNSGYMAAEELPPLVVTPSAITFGFDTSVGSIIAGAMILNPAPITFRFVFSSPQGNATGDLDGFFSYMAQAFGYTNTDRFKRDTNIAADLASGVVYWLYATSTLADAQYQLPRVLLAYDTKSENFGLGYPIPSTQTGTHTPLKTKNLMRILTNRQISSKNMLQSVVAIGNDTGQGDEEQINSEINDKTVYRLDSRSFAGINNTFGKCLVYSKIFKPKDTPEFTKTRIIKIRPIWSLGTFSESLKMSSKLWTFNTYFVDDNFATEDPYTISTHVDRTGAIVYDDSVFGIEHCFSFELDTNNGESSIPAVSRMTSSGIVGFEIEYEEQEDIST